MRIKQKRTRTIIKLDDINAEVTQKKIKNLHLRVCPPEGNVLISAPCCMNQEKIRVFALSKLDWIRKQRQSIRNQLCELPDKYIDQDPSDRKPLLLILDSLGMLSTTKEMEDTAEGKETRDMTRAQIVKAVFRVLTLKLGKAKVPLIITNHTYDVVGSMFPKKEMGGGSGLKYASSSIVYLSRRKEKDGTEIIGNIIHCKNYKSRLTRENALVDVRLTYDKGLDRYYGLLAVSYTHLTLPTNREV